MSVSSVFFGFRSNTDGLSRYQNNLTTTNLVFCIVFEYTFLDGVFIAHCQLRYILIKSSMALHQEKP